MDNRNHVQFIEYDHEVNQVYHLFLVLCDYISLLCGKRYLFLHPKSDIIVLIYISTVAYLF
jgi:hypothetical protein